MTYQKALAIVLTVFITLATPPAMARTAQDILKYLPDKVLNFTSTQPPSMQDQDKEGAEFHRVQKIYDKQTGGDQMAVVAAICGPGVPGNIKAQFAKGQLATVQKFDAVLLPPPDKNSPIITVSVKLDSDCMITAMILNSTNTDDAIGFLKALDLEGLAKWPREEMATCHYHPRLWSQATRRTPATASCSLHLGQTCTVGTKCG